MNKYKLLKFILPLVLCILTAFFAKGQITFDKVYPLPFVKGVNFSAKDVEQTLDSGFIVLCAKQGYPISDSVDTFALLRLDKYGDSLWFKKYESGKVPSSIAVLGDSGFAIGAGNLYRTDQFGNLLWIGDLPKGKLNYIQAEGNAGFVGFASEKSEIYHFNNSGNLIWKIKSAFPIEDMKPLKETDFVILKYLYGQSSNTTELEHYDSAGNLVKYRKFNYDVPDNFIVTSENSFLVSEFSYGSRVGYYLLIDSSFNVIWKHIYYNLLSSFTYPNESLIADDGFALSWQWFFGYHPYNLIGGNASVIFFIDKNGTVKWGRHPHYGGVIESIHRTNDQGLVIAQDQTGYGINVIKTDELGKIMK